GGSAAKDPVEGALMPKYHKAKTEGGQETQDKLLAVCPSLADSWKPPPEATPEERLAQKAQLLRQLQAQQGRLKKQLVQAAQSFKDLQDKLNVNIDDCLATQKTIDELVGKAKTAAPQSEARQAQQARQAEEEDFPELDAGELASLDEPTRTTYKEASEAHNKARSVLKSATDAGKAAREAAERLRKVRESIKRRRGDDGLAAAAGDKTSEVEAQPASKERVDFIDAAAIETYIEQTAALRAMAAEIKKLRYKGWQSQFTWAPATPTGRSTSGHVTSAHLPDGTGQSVFQKELSDISIILWRLKGATLALISVYLERRVGLDDPANIAKMIQLTRVVRSLGVPWIALGDWNVTPADMQLCPWLKAFRGELLIPNDCAVTCATGKGRLIDYGILSRDFRPFVRFSKPVRDVPWSPHVGLHLRLHVRPASVKVLMPIQPVKIEIHTTTMHKKRNSSGLNVIVRSI
ncbi:unnamed protein product, partial [Prorocentrum cordatum]